MIYMSWGVNEQAIAALENMSSQLTEVSDRIKQETQKLRTSFEDNEDGLGPHTSSILALIEEVEQTDEEASAPVKKLVLKLTRAAQLRRDQLENDRYKGGRSR